MLDQGRVCAAARRRGRSDRDHALYPDEGAPLLELHLERIKASATELNYAFDRHAVRNAIQALCFEADAPARLRLAAARSGAYSARTGPAARNTGPTAALRGLALPVDPGDWRLRHKTAIAAFTRRDWLLPQAAGADEALFVRDDGLSPKAALPTCLSNVTAACSPRPHGSACCPACCAAR
jgi:branched-subunit amino acid aminotransferase/4-amino-4-deoxychorismate lyase